MIRFTLSNGATALPMVCGGRILVSWRTSSACLWNLLHGRALIGSKCKLECVAKGGLGNQGRRSPPSLRTPLPRRTSTTTSGALHPTDAPASTTYPTILHPVVRRRVSRMDVSFIVTGNMRLIQKSCVTSSEFIRSSSLSIRGENTVYCCM